MRDSSSQEAQLAKRILADPGLPAKNPTPSRWQTPPCDELLGLQSPRLPEQRDVVVIGSGITGCSAAWHLLEKGSPELTVAVLDAREICSGATGRNGGRIHCTAVQDYDKYSRILGRDAAREIVKFELAHLAAYHKFAKELGPKVLEECEMRHTRVVSAIFDQDVLEDVKLMLENFKRDFPDLADLYNFVDAQQTEALSVKNAKGALVYTVGAVWPYRLITKAFQVARSRHEGRLSIETNTPVIAVAKHENEDQYLVKTPRGIIRARHVVHCTEGHSAHLLPSLRGVIVPLRGQMTVQTLEGVPESAHAGSCYTFIFGQSFDYGTPHPVTGEVWIGGGSQLTVEGAPEFLAEPSDAEESVIAKAHLSGVLPTVLTAGDSASKTSISTKVNSSWTGIMGFSLDRLPLVGRLPTGDIATSSQSQTDTGNGEWVSVGYGGYGMVNAFLCGQALVNMILGLPGQDLPQAYLLTPERLKRLSTQARQVLSSPRQVIKSFL